MARGNRGWTQPVPSPMAPLTPEQTRAMQDRRLELMQANPHWSVRSAEQAARQALGLAQ